MTARIVRETAMQPPARSAGGSCRVCGWRFSNPGDSRFPQSSAAGRAGAALLGGEVEPRVVVVRLFWDGGPGLGDAGDKIFGTK